MQVSNTKPSFVASDKTEYGHDQVKSASNHTADNNEMISLDLVIDAARDGEALEQSDLDNSGNN